MHVQTMIMMLIFLQQTNSVDHAQKLYVVQCAIDTLHNCTADAGEQTLIDFLKVSEAGKDDI